MAKNINNIRKINELKTIMALVFFTFIFIMTWQVFKPYTITVILSVVYCILVWPMYKWFAHKHNWKSIFATLMTLFITVVAVAIPLIILVIVLIGALSDAVVSVEKFSDSNQFTDVVNTANNYLTDLSSGKISISLDSISSEASNLIKKFGSILANSIVSIGTASVALVTNILVFLMIVFSLLPKLRDTRKYVERISPFSKVATSKYVVRSSHLMVDVIKGSFVIAFAQGLAGGLMLWILGGSNNIAVLTFLMMVASIIPMLGTGLVTVPIAIIMLIQGDVVSAIVLLLWQIFVIGNVDTVLRPKLVSKESEMPQAIMLIAVLGGIKAFGLIGLLIGPIVLIMFLTSLEVYNSEYK